MSRFTAFAKNLSKHSYQLQLVVLFAVPVWFLLYSVIYMPESPRWLATHDRHDEALKSLRKIRGSNFSEAELQAELDIIVEAIRVEREVQAGATFLDIFRYVPRYLRFPSQPSSCALLWLLLHRY